MDDLNLRKGCSKEKLGILIGGDYLARCLLAEILHKNEFENLLIIEDRSVSVRRIYSLLIKRRITLKWLALKIYAAVRQGFFIQKQMHFQSRLHNVLQVKNNKELNVLIQNNKDLCAVVCFRAGLIVGQNNIDLIPFYNIHCAKLPAYPGLMSIYSALKDRDFEQQSSFHTITKEIDQGKVIETEPYKLDPSKTYWRNEILAYESGKKLLSKVINNFCSQQKNLMHI